MANLRFPSNVDTGNKPFVLFSTHRAEYNNFGNKVDVVKTPNSVALYLPAGHTISDSLNYQTESTGLIGAATAATVEGTNVNTEDITNIAKAILTNKETAAQAAGATGGLLGFLGAGSFGGLVAGSGAASIIGNVGAELAPQVQQSLNPREFMLFKSPNIRNFGFTFTFIPSNNNEVEDVPKIIKFFRRASYPSIHAINAVYNFPEAFNINVGNSDKIIKIPEVFCIGVTVTYNPNTMSYFRIDNMPVEISLQLQFQELKPISREFVEEGY
jgi:hypothetical protein